MKKLIILAGVAFLLPTLSLAAYVGAGDSITVPESTQNAYIAGGTVNISNPVSGDALVAGGTIIVSGEVGGDVMAVGGNVSFIGGSAEDVRVAGGNITIGGEVNGEVMIVGGQITVTSDTTIKEDSYIVGGTLVFSGKEEGNLTIIGGKVRIDGTINGDLSVKGADEVTFGSQTVVEGMVEYSAPKEAVIEEGAQLANPPVFNKTQDLRRGLGIRFAAFFGVMFILKILAILFAAYLLWYLRRDDVVAVIKNTHGHFWKMLLHGFAVLILFPVAGIILLVTVVGWIPAVLILTTYGALLALMAPISVIVVTSIVMTIFKKSSTGFKWYHILLGLVIWKILAWIPFIGWFICFLILLISLGATINILKSKFSK